MIIDYETLDQITDLEIEIKKFNAFRFGRRSN